MALIIRTILGAVIGGFTAFGLNSLFVYLGFAPPWEGMEEIAIGICCIGGGMLGFISGLNKRRIRHRDTEEEWNMEALEIRKKALSVSELCRQKEENMPEPDPVIYQSGVQMNRIVKELKKAAELKSIANLIAEDGKKERVEK